MKAFMLILIVAALLQSSVVPFNLVLLLLLARSLVKPSLGNLWLGFFSGILLGLLTSQNLGFYALVLVGMVELMNLLKSAPVSSNYLTVPLVAAVLLIVSVLEQLFLHQLSNWNLIVVETALFLPVFVTVKFWEERFIPTPAIKLKL